MAIKLIHTGKRGQPRSLKKGADLRLLTSIPPAPSYFTPQRAAVWREYAGVLIDRGDLSEGDLGALENYVMSLCDYRDFTADLNINGYTHTNVQGNIVQRPQCNLRRQAEMQLTVAGASLGLSPRGRSAMKREAQADEGEPDEVKTASAF